jgi:hypothetical protein
LRKRSYPNESDLKTGQQNSREKKSRKARKEAQWEARFSKQSTLPIVSVRCSGRSKFPQRSPQIKRQSYFFGNTPNLDDFRTVLIFFNQPFASKYNHDFIAQIHVLKIHQPSELVLGIQERLDG